MKILILTALSREHNHFRRITGSWRKSRRGPIAFRELNGDDKTLFLVDSGMGATPVRETLDWAVDHIAPELLVSAGYGGSISNEFQVGDVVLGAVFCGELTPGGWEETRCLALPIAEKRGRLPGQRPIRPARIVTVARPRAKRELRVLYADTPSVIDMETLYAAGAAYEKGIPFLSLRAVSDGPEHEIEYDLDAISNPAGKIRIGGVLSLIRSNPRVIGAFYRSWKRSVEAGRRLGECLAELLLLPAADLNRFVGDCRLEERLDHTVHGR